MSHFAFFCLPFYSHLRVFEAVAGTLQRRGHRVTLLVNEGAGRLVADAGLTVIEIAARPGERRDPEAVIRRAARPNGPFGILRTVTDTVALSEAFCAGAPAVLRRIGADAIVGDQMEPAAGLVAEFLQMPHASLAAALPINPAPGIPLPFLDWPFDTSEAGLKRNDGGDKVARLLLRRQRRMIARWAERFALTARADLVDCLSPTLQIAQTVSGFDFPRPSGGTAAGGRSAARGRDDASAPALRSAARTAAGLRLPRHIAGPSPRPVPHDRRRLPGRRLPIWSLPIAEASAPRSPGGSTPCTSPTSSRRQRFWRGHRSA